MSSAKKRRASQTPNTTFENVRVYLLEHIRQSTSVSVAFQSYNNFLFNAYFMASSLLGEQLTYVVALPFLCWQYDSRLGRVFLFLLCIGTTVGSFLKNLFALPRPPSPPVKKSSYTDLKDFGFPSNHSLNSLALPLFLAIYHWDNYDLNRNLIHLALVAWWSLSMMASRLYLGAHSLLDVVAGGIVGLVVSVVWGFCYETFDTWALTNEQAPIYVGIISLCVIAIHPRSRIGAPSFKYTVALMGLLPGLVFGAWYAQRHLMDVEQRYDIKGWFAENAPWLKLTETTILIIKTFLGIFVLELFNLLSKQGTRMITGLFCSIPVLGKGLMYLADLTEVFAVPHGTPLDNTDYPQFKEAIEDMEYVREGIHLPDWVRAFTIGASIMFFVPAYFIYCGLDTGMYEILRLKQ